VRWVIVTSIIERKQYEPCQTSCSTLTIWAAETNNRWNILHIQAAGRSAYTLQHGFLGLTLHLTQQNEFTRASFISLLSVHSLLANLSFYQSLVCLLTLRQRFPGGTAGRWGWIHIPPSRWMYEWVVNKLMKK